MISMEEARARVARGAAHLDVAKPGWVNAVNTDRLDLGDECLCVLGQLYGDYSDALRHFEWNIRLVPSGFCVCPESVALGFGISPDDADGSETCWPSLVSITRGFQIIQDAWIEAIAARLHPDSQPAIETPAAVTV